MGLYDTINGYQVKMFTICYPVLNEDGSFSVREIGGEMKDYEKGNVVPWKRKYYNLGKNFDIVSMFADERFGKDLGVKSIVVHQIRNGKVRKSVPLKWLPDKFEYDVYTDHGIKFKKVSKAILKDYKESLLYLQNLEMPSNALNKKMMEYYRSHKKDSDLKVNIDKMLNQIEKQSKEDYEKFVRPIHEKMNEYIGSDFMSETLDDEQLLGMLVDCLVDRYFDFKKFIVFDERLEYIVFATEMLKFYEKVDLEHFFNRFGIDEDERETFKKDVKKIEETANSLKNVKYSKKQFASYSLSDLEHGRFAEIYKKYGIIPYDSE